MIIWLIGFMFTFGLLVDEDDKDTGILVWIISILIVFFFWPFALGSTAMEVLKKSNLYPWSKND